MTGEGFAELVNARRAGAGKWQARCPSHEDHHPSLTITQGHSGVLLCCWSHGCTPEDICKALGIRVADLFHDHGLTPAERTEAARRSREREAERKAGHHAAIERNRELLKLERLADALGDLLARNPDDAEVERLFTGVLGKLRRLASEIPCHEDGPNRIEPAPETPARIANELRQVFAPEPTREPNPDAVGFDDLAAWIELQPKQQTARCERAA